MYSSEDLERFYFKYQTEALPHGQSLQSFCLSNKVPYRSYMDESYASCTAYHYDYHVDFHEGYVKEHCW